MVVLDLREGVFIKEPSLESRIIYIACALIPRIIFEWERNFTWLELGENEVLPSVFMLSTVCEFWRDQLTTYEVTHQHIPRNSIGVFPSGDFTHWHLLRST